MRRKSTGQTVAQVLFVPTSATVRKECDGTAAAVAYAVPCPTMLPVGMAPTPEAHGCRLGIIGEGGGPNCAANWRGWIVGSSTDCCEHLGLLGAPRVIRNPARAIDGPGMFPGSRVQSRGTVTIAGKTMHWYYVPPDLNQGSAAAHHLVLVWNASGHTYSYGFHVVSTFAAARALDLELVRHLVTVHPPHTR